MAKAIAEQSRSSGRVETFIHPNIYPAANSMKQILQVYFTGSIGLPAHLLLLVRHSNVIVGETFMNLSSDKWCLNYGTTCKIHLSTSIEFAPGVPDAQYIANIWYHK